MISLGKRKENQAKNHPTKTKEKTHTHPKKTGTAKQPFPPQTDLKNVESFNQTETPIWTTQNNTGSGNKLNFNLKHYNEKATERH